MFGLKLNTYEQLKEKQFWQTAGKFKAISQ